MFDRSTKLPSDSAYAGNCRIELTQPQTQVKTGGGLSRRGYAVKGPASTAHTDRGGGSGPKGEGPELYMDNWCVNWAYRNQAGGYLGMRCNSLEPKLTSAWKMLKFLLI